VDRGCGDGGSVAGVVEAVLVGIGDEDAGEGETGGGMEREVDVGKVDEPKSKEFMSWDIRGIGPEGVCGGEKVDLGWTEAYGKIFS
jgi:hypothetical protein